MLQQRGVPKTIIILSILFIAGLCLTVFMQGLAYSEGLATQATQVSGNITTNTTWTLANSPYVITESVFVAQGVTLTIESGVEVRGQETQALNIDGHLEAVGTAVNPIIFTSDNGAVGGWSGIIAEDDGSALLEHVVIEKGHTNIYIWGWQGSNIQIQNSQISESETYPIHVFRTSALHRLQLSNVAFVNNNVDRVLIDPDWQNFEDTWKFKLFDDVQLTSQSGLDGYEIPYPLIVPNGITLTIDSGVTIMASGGTGFAVINIDQGAHLEAVGSSSNPIIFTSVDDSGPGEWTSMVIEGTANIQYAHFRNSEFNLDIRNALGAPIILENSLISNSSGPSMFVAVDAIHRLEMSNVTFANNVPNRVWLIHYFDGDQFSDNATLKPMPGLEGYEYNVLESWNVSPTPILKVPEGIMLTIEPDTTLFMPENSVLNVAGHLQAVGELGHSVTFTPTGDVLSGPQVDPWTGIVFDTTGTGNISYANLQKAGVAVGVFGASDRPVFIENSVFANGYYGAVASPDSLHRLNMENVTFENNEFNYIGLEVSDGFDTFTDDIVLKTQPGLEGYLIPTDYYPSLTHDKIVIPEGVHLQMDPGSALFMADSMRMEVEGTLQINGSAQHPVTIQADSPGNEWAGIILNGGSAILNHGQLRNAETAVSLQSPTSTLTVTNTTFSQNNTGILANTGSVTATCATFSNNTRGVYLNPGGTGTVNIHQSNLSGNATAGIDNEGAGMINAENNWWGAADGPSGDGPGSGDAVFGNVLYVPWLDEVTCAANYQNFLPVVIRP